MILEGFSMPFVLRRRGDEFVIIGDAYIHGIMDGELICAVDERIELDDSKIGYDSQGKAFYARTPGDGFATLQNFSLV